LHSKEHVKLFDIFVYDAGKNLLFVKWGLERLCVYVCIYLFPIKRNKKYEKKRLEYKIKKQKHTTKEYTKTRKIKNKWTSNYKNKNYCLKIIAQG